MRSTLTRSILIAACLFPFSAYAQVGTSKTTSALITETNVLIFDNVNGLISPANARQVFLDIIASYANLKTPAVNVFGTGIYAATANYGPGVDITGTLQSLVSGSVATGTTNPDALLIVQKNSAVTGLAGVSNPNPAAYFSLTKNTNGADRGVALFAEAQDFAGSALGFIEGLRTHAVLSGGALGEVFALEATASAVGVTYTSLIAAEANAFNSSGVNAPAVFNGTAPPTLAVGFITENDGANFADVGFLVNPFSIGKFRRGFVVGNNSVDQVAFASYATTVTGLDLTGGATTFAAIAIGNNQPIRMQDTTLVSNNVMWLDASDTFTVGLDAVTTNIPRISNATALTTVTATLTSYASPLTSSRVRINGFTGGAGAFGISGFTHSTHIDDGQKIYLYQAQAQTMTIGNEDVGTPNPANRILTNLGKDLVLAGPSFVTFSYDGTAQRWIVESHVP